MEILIATHKEKCLLQNSIFKPIQTNIEHTKIRIDESYYLDNTGDNITLKNENYSEITALYWLWKNKKDVSVLGLAHYRRYFNFLNYSFIKPHRITNVEKNDKIFKQHNNQEKIIKKRILKWLKNYDVILPYKRSLKSNHKYISITNEYCLNHIENDWDVTMKIIAEKYPAYQNSITKYLDNNNKIFLMNMFISNRKFVDDYCTWLFDILFEVEKKINFSDDAYQKRVFGFISERLFTLYIFHNKLKVKELPLLFIKDYF